MGDTKYSLIQIIQRIHVINNFFADLSRQTAKKLKTNPNATLERDIMISRTLFRNAEKLIKAKQFLQGVSN